MEIGNLLIFAVVIIFLLYKLGKKNQDYWSKKGLRQNRPWPFFGDNYAAFLRIYDGIQLSNHLYEPFVEHGLGGIYLFHIPFLMVTDTEILKQIMVKDADCFVNRHDWSGGSDPLMSKNLATLRDEKWRKMRAVMTTVFTSAKMKDMFKFMNTCGQQSVQYIQDKVDKQVKENHPDGNVVEMEFKDFFSRYGTDVIATTAFGLEVDSLKNPENEFYQSGVAIRQVFQGKALIRFLIMMAFPGLAKKLNITFLGSKCNEFFDSVVSETIKEREAKNIRRTDVIQILMDARKGKCFDDNGEYLKGKLPELSDTDIAAQAIIFFFAGFETIATLLSFMSYELATHPEIQAKLQEEIDEVVEKENGVTYDGVVHQMQYLNMVVHETLRKWPPAVFSDREVSKPFTLPKTDKSPAISLSRGDKIMIPIAGIQRDPRHFPDPDKFDPERFRDEKSNIKPFTFLAFGEGLRHCIGMRYALMEAKTVMAQVLRNFTIVPTKKTDIPMKLSKQNAFMLMPEKGFWLGFKPRK